jgi:hypothetical protein
MYIIRTNITDA